jgi:hypothetical protein
MSLAFEPPIKLLSLATMLSHSSQRLPVLRIAPLTLSPQSLTMYEAASTGLQ